MRKFNKFSDELTDIIASLTAESYTDDIPMCGDASYPGPDESSVDLELSEGLDSVGLTQLVTQLTRRLSGAAKLRQPARHPRIPRCQQRQPRAVYISDLCLLSAAVAARGYLAPGANVCVAAPHPPSGVFTGMFKSERYISGVHFQKCSNFSIFFTVNISTIFSHPKVPRRKGTPLDTPWPLQPDWQ